MLTDLTADQAFFHETTARFLDKRVPTGELRRLRDNATGFDRDYWRQGAELGWTSLLVSEAHGGGTISGRGLVDLTLVAHEFGTHAAPGPLVSCNVAAAALDANDSHDDVLQSLLTGEGITSWAHAEPIPHRRLGTVTAEVTVDGTTVVVRGRKHVVESAMQTRHLLVTGRTGDGLTQVLVPTDAPGVSMTPMRSVDLTRRFSAVELHDVRLPADAVVGEVGGATEQVEHQLETAIVLTNAETIGAMDRALAMTVEWAFDRFSFGRPLASYQEIKHRFADMRCWLEASHAISDVAAAAVQDGAADASELVSAAKSYIGQYGAELLQDCVQLHGGIGVTFEHDLHLFLRRVTLDRALYGTPAEHRSRVVDLIQGAAA